LTSFFFSLFFTCLDSSTENDFSLSVLESTLELDEDFGREYFEGLL